MSTGSWVPGAQESGFPLEHLPYAVDRTVGPVVGIGDFALPLRSVDRVFDHHDLNPFLAAGRRRWGEVRARVTELLGDPDHRIGVEPQLVRREDLHLVLPIAIGDYADFYASINHATNVGRIFRPNGEPLPPNYRHLPIGYHGRAGTVVVSGTPIRRPSGLVPDGEGPPVHRPSTRLDVELEVGVVVGSSSAQGEPIAIGEADDHIFGLALVNDWSARDIQAFESQPLGPFLGKSFATSMAAWITPLDAVRPWLVDAPSQQPEPTSYLRTERPWAIDLALEVWLRRAGEEEPTRICSVNFSSMYWTIAQQLAHLTANGASTRPGDLFASGTVSGPDRGSEGSLLESGIGFLGDGDEVTLRGRCGSGPVIELGPVDGKVVL